MPAMQWLQHLHIVQSPDRPTEIKLVFPNQLERDRAWTDIENQKALFKLEEENPPPNPHAHTLDMLDAIHETASGVDVDLQQAHRQLTFILGVTHGLIRNLGGLPPMIPEGFFQRRRTDET